MMVLHLAITLRTSFPREGGRKRRRKSFYGRMIVFSPVASPAISRA